MTLKSPRLVQGGSTVFLQIVLVLVGIGVLAAMLRFPQTEGRAAHLSLVEVYLDPGVAYGYTASIPFFVALYQAFRVLGYAAAKRSILRTFAPGRADHKTLRDALDRLCGRTGWCTCPSPYAARMISPAGVALGLFIIAGLER